MRPATAALALCTFWAIRAPANAESLVTSLSTHRVAITSTYSGAEIVVFGAIERDSSTVARNAAYDVVITVRGPRRTTLVREKEQAGLIWLNRAQRRFIDLPVYLAVLSTQPIDDVADPTLRRRQRIGIDANLKPVGIDIDIDAGGGRFRDALKRLKIDEGLFIENGRAVTFLTPTIFRAPIPLPATAPSGPYDVDILLIVGGALLAHQTANFEVIKSGFEQTVVSAAQNRSLGYGIGVAGLALMFGWVASVIFRRD
jgi:uncharacterized protein (TIGR02186 family)